MSKKLYDYFLNELDYLYGEGSQFALAHPDAARHLDFRSSTEADDPYVRRLCEAFAFLTARGRLRLDEDLGQFASGLLDLLLPIWTRPWPAAGVVQCSLADEVGVENEGITLPRGTPLLAYSSKVANGGKSPEFHFRTAAETRVLRLKIEQASLLADPVTAGNEVPPQLNSALALFRITLRHQIPNLPVAQQWRGPLRFYLNLPSQQDLVREFLLNPQGLLGITVQVPEQVPGHRELRCELPISHLRRYGFEPDQMLLDSAPQAPLAYQLLTEVLAYPCKHFFFELDIPEAFRQKFRLADGKWRTDTPRLNLNFYYRRSPPDTLHRLLSGDPLMLNCVPVVNLHQEPPIQQSIDHLAVDQLLDLPGEAGPFREIYSLDKVEAFSGKAPRDKEWMQLRPMFSVDARTLDQTKYYHTHRREIARDSSAEAKIPSGTSLLLSLVDERFDPYEEFGFEKLQFTAQCCDRRLANLGTLKELTGWKILGAGEFSSAVQPLENSWSRMQSPPTGMALWSLFSLLNLNHRLFSGDAATESVKELILLLARGTEREREELRKLLGIFRRIESRSCVDRIRYDSGEIKSGVPAVGAVARGIQLDYELDLQAEQRKGQWLLLLEALDRLAALQVSINSFVQTRVLSEQDKRTLIEFEKRCGSSKII